MHIKAEISTKKSPQLTTAPDTAQARNNATSSYESFMPKNSNSKVTAQFYEFITHKTEPQSKIYQAAAAYSSNPQKGQQAIITGPNAIKTVSNSKFLNNSIRKLQPSGLPLNMP